MNAILARKVESCVCVQRAAVKFVADNNNNSDEAAVGLI